MALYQLTYLKMMNTNLKDENYRLQDQLNRLEAETRRLQAHIELQRAEIIALQNRDEKSRELKELFSPPPRRDIKITEIDNRNKDAQ